MSTQTHFAFCSLLHFFLSLTKVSPCQSTCRHISLHLTKGLFLMLNLGHILLDLTDPSLPFETFCLISQIHNVLSLTLRHILLDLSPKSRHVSQLSDTFISHIRLSLMSNLRHILLDLTYTCPFHFPLKSFAQFTMISLSTYKHCLTQYILHDKAWKSSLSFTTDFNCLC